MSAAQYGGEDINALVFDMGSAVCKMGYGGDFEPKAIFPSAIGKVVNKSEMETDSKPNTTYFTGAKLSTPVDNMEISHPIRAGVIVDFDGYEQLLNHGYKHMGVDPSHHPVLFAEPIARINDQQRMAVLKETKIKQAELMFDKFEIPAMQMVKCPVLSLFGQSRHSGLVIDVGASQTTVVPVIEGNVMHRQVVSVHIGGEFILDSTRRWVSDKANFAPDVFDNFWPFKLPYEIKSKESVPDGKKPKYVLKDLSHKKLTDSWLSYQHRLQYQDIAEHVLHCSDRDLTNQDLRNFPQCNYEFPNGYGCDFGFQRFQIPEFLFNPGMARHSELSNQLGISNLVQNSIQQCDPDMRPQVLGNILISGGCTAINGFAERMANEVATRFGVRTKVIQPMTSPANERKYSAWIGGSILASVGSFHSHWITKSEWEEHGSSVFDKKNFL